MSDRLDAAIRELLDALREEVERAAESNGPTRLLSVDEVAAAMSLGRSKVYSEMAANRLRSLKVGDRRLVPASALREYIESAMAAE